MIQAAGQVSMFDGDKKFKINKPIRLIELFAGYGSQALALKYLGVPFEHWRICEWAVKSIQAYKDCHFKEDDADYSAELTKEEIFDKLCEYGISADYEKPMGIQQIKRLGESKARKIYNNIIATHNLVSVCNVKGEDFEIIDTDKYCYIMTWSFPCQDLSNAGQKKGMAEGSGTRSGLGWEVIRILKECKERPKVLLMENVPPVIGKDNIKEFSKMIAELETLGYTSKWEILNATDFNVPQNRERCFMVSILGTDYYDFPKPIGCKRKLKDMLESNVSEEYYLKPEVVIQLIKHKERHDAKGNGFGWKPIDTSVNGGGYARTIKTESDYRPDTNFIIEHEGNGDRERTNGCEHSNGDRLQRVRQSADERSNGNNRRGGVIQQANGIDIGKSKAFFCGELKDISRTLSTDNKSGVVEWKD